MSPCFWIYKTLYTGCQIEPKAIITSSQSRTKFCKPPDPTLFMFSTVARSPNKGGGGLAVEPTILIASELNWQIDFLLRMSVYWRKGKWYYADAGIYADEVGLMQRFAFILFYLTIDIRWALTVTIMLK